MYSEWIQRLDMRLMKVVLIYRSHAPLNEQKVALQMVFSIGMCILELKLIRVQVAAIHPAKAESAKQSKAVVTKRHHQMRTENESRDSIYRTRRTGLLVSSPSVCSHLNSIRNNDTASAMNRIVLHMSRSVGRRRRSRAQGDGFAR